MPRKPLPDKGMQTSLRLPRDLYDRLTEAAGEKGIGEEIRRRLEASFFGKQLVIKDDRVGDLLDAIAHAAAAAGQMHPLATSGDITAYVTLEEAITMLIEGFRPDGEPSATPRQIWHAAGMIAGMALGALGERGTKAVGRLRAELHKEDDAGEKQS